MIKHKDHFDSLINDMRARIKKNKGSDNRVNPATKEGTKETSTGPYGESSTFDTHTTAKNDVASKANEFLKPEKEATVCASNTRSSNIQNVPSCSRVNESMDPTGHESAAEDVGSSVQGYSEDGPNFTDVSTCFDLRRKNDGFEGIAIDKSEGLVIGMLDKAVSKALTVVKKMHSACCKNRIASPSKCNCGYSKRNEPFAVLQRKVVDYAEEEEVALATSALETDQNSFHEKRALTGPGLSHDVTVTAKDPLIQKRANSSTRGQDRASSQREAPTPANDADLILILGSDEELDEAVDPNRGYVVQSTPRRDSVTRRFENVVSPLANASFSSVTSSQLKDSTVSATPKPDNLTRIGTKKESNFRKTAAVERKEKSRNDKTMSNNCRGKAKSGKVRPKRNETKSKSNKKKVKSYMTKNITSFFRKIEDEDARSFGLEINNSRDDKGCKKKENLHGGLNSSHNLFSCNSSSDESHSESLVSANSDHSLLHKTITNESKGENSGAEMLSRTRQSLRKKTSLDDYRTDDSDFEVSSRSRHPSQKKTRILDHLTDDSEFEISSRARHSSQKKTANASQENTTVSKALQHSDCSTTNESTNDSPIGMDYSNETVSPKTRGSSRKTKSSRLPSPPSSLHVSESSSNSDESLKF